MTATSKILCDSITDGGSRLTTWELRYARSQHAAVMTYRSCSRNGASSRAIPTAKARQAVLDDIAYPVEFGKNQRGMQARDVMIGDEHDQARAWFELAAKSACDSHYAGELLGLHKQIVNRVVEPFAHMTLIMTATQQHHANLFAQRVHQDADPSIQQLARAMREEYYDRAPIYTPVGKWHLPLVGWYNGGPESEPDMTHVRDSDLVKISTGRCARVSYLTHDGRRDVTEDVGLHDKLLGTVGGADPGHFSPFEHPCIAVGGRERHGPYEGWRSYRSMLPGEAGPDSTINRCDRCGIWDGQHAKKCVLA